ncbi:DUF6160 family protein [Marinobacter sp. DUT-1]|uniref:DUF6160 family protein n=1 Tax=Marinobacter sp. DUT-1 TaxID=3412037 RepID=UPI003D17D433
MKGLKLTLPALCVAGAPLFAQADIQMLDETSMGNITGQAGVSIELETKIGIGRFTYTDEGSLAINDIRIGGTNRTDLFGFNGMGGPVATDTLDNIRIDIDILADGDAAINIQPTYFNAVDFRISTGSWQLLSSDGSESTTFLDNFVAEGVMGRGEIHIDTSTDVMRFATAIGIERMDFDVPFLAVGVRGMSITGADWDPYVFRNPMDVFAEVELFIYEGARLAGPGSALAIDMPVFEADMRIDELIVGQQSIGSIFLDNLAITDTAMRIYGH